MKKTFINKLSVTFGFELDPSSHNEAVKESPSSHAFIPKRRIVHLDLKGAAPKPQHFRAFFEYFVRIGATGILIEWEDMFPYKGQLSDLRNGDAYSADDVRMILSTADQLRLEVIPLVQTIGHLEWLLKTHKFSSFRENPQNPQSVCVSNAEAVDLVLHLVDQVMAFHKDYGQFVHIGADEVYQYGECSRCVARMNKEKLRREDLLLRHIVNVSKHVKSKYGKNVLMWHDMIANIDASLAEKYDLKNLVEPVLWNYAEDLEAFLPMGIWETFAAMVPYMWGSSAFKGADSPNRYVLTLLSNGVMDFHLSIYYGYSTNHLFRLNRKQIRRSFQSPTCVPLSTIKRNEPRGTLKASTDLFMSKPK
ncbi:Glyco hydro 20 domain containing protein [Trichuris trichiura]|uniref:beta-N-acetylhexosaminidase n=1 Tax=Trichuris trichiura TaxID=36087 RepID=A0A077ZFQ6_TRITR|nr:Glyco hydro 20 domain containing protein [Trichuris trichiura]